ncbi:MULTISPECIES: TraI/MobA(P) family conjugative relaxase [Pseudomonas]|uniref:TraI/MobA(P) family conjugative relaxase n=1 Tax=Pseudomonas TaxID=286 RepID=UPI002AB4B3EE|nr:TraI/MobA(P) family conjugative relaxase [Pseudomonas sp. CCC4.1]MDY7572677.1 TraI/MobA(P) family conjugative relaxase [Pseudomonas sp. CCC4.1]
MPMNEARLSSFGNLVKYISNSQEKQERVGEIRLTNFQNETLEWAVAEALAVQQCNQRAEGDKTYHLLISFAPGEQPSAEVLRDIEDRMCAAIGFGEHQRVSAVHHDTDNLHIHIAINKIHPERYTIHEPYRDYKVRSDMCAVLEREHGLQLTNQKGRKRGSENGADDMEQHAGIESLLGWIKRECADQLTQAHTWNDLHEVMRKNGLELQERGNGLVITDGSGVGVKASSVSRNLSKPSLEKRLGAFEGDTKKKASAKRGPGLHNRKAPPVVAVGGKPPPMRKGRLSTLSQLGAIEGEPGKRYEGRPIHSAGSTATTELYARYKAEQGIKVHARATAWGAAKNRKDKAVEAAKGTGRLKRAAIKMLSGPGVNKKLLYALVSKALHAEIQKANTQYLAERQSIHGEFSKRAWADWLQAKATEGDQQALKALRARKPAKPRAGDTVAGSGPARRSSPMPLKVDSVTKDGTVIHRFAGSAIRDDGEALQVARGSNRAGLEAVLRMAVHRYGQNIAVNGSDEFKEKIARVAATSNLNITFNDAALEARCQELVRLTSKESGNDRSSRPNRSADERRRSASSSDGGSRTKRGGRTARTGVRRGPGQTNKSGLGGVGPKPPALSGNGLRELSQLGVVRLPERSEVLLPRDVPHSVQHEGAEHAGGMRRGVSGAGRRVGKNPRGPGATNKPGVIPVGGLPPAMLRGRLQPMSKIRELPVDGPISVPGMPRPPMPKPAPEITMPAQPKSAADKYIAERTSKRAKGFDIPNHRRYTQDDKGAALFAGTRQIEGETLALLKRDEEIIVLPVDAATARRIKRYSLGDAVTLNDKGAVTKKGRSR